jgi:hypothetical protein
VLSALLTRPDRLCLQLAALPCTSAWMMSMGSLAPTIRRCEKVTVTISDAMFRTLFKNRLITFGHCNFMPPTMVLVPFPKVLCHSTSVSGKKVCQRELDPDLMHTTSGCHFVRYKAHQTAATALERVASSLGFSCSAIRAAV